MLIIKRFFFMDRFEQNDSIIFQIRRLHFRISRRFGWFNMVRQKSRIRLCLSCTPIYLYLTFLYSSIIISMTKSEESSYNRFCGS